MIIEAPVGGLTLSEYRLVFLRVGVDVILELEKFLLVDREQRVRGGVGVIRVIKEKKTLVGT